MKKHMEKIKWLGIGLSIIFLCACDNGSQTLKISDNKTDNTTLLIRKTQFGLVEGKESGNVLIWLGIPYGGDTSGSVRWKTPSDPQPWQYTLDASVSGDVALQSGSDGITGSENALNLDIYRPNNNETNLPVMVYVHGGNNQTGLSEEISGVSFVENHNATIVSVNYRLGPLGFNPLSALKTGSNSAEDSGNYALLDLHKSLEWVRANIEYFGGDAQNVTVASFSAGGCNVMAMLISRCLRARSIRPFPLAAV